VGRFYIHVQHDFYGDDDAYLEVITDEREAETPFAETLLKMVKDEHIADLILEGEERAINWNDIVKNLHESVIEQFFSQHGVHVCRFCMYPLRTVYAYDPIE